MAHAHKPDFFFRAKRTSPFKSAEGRQFSRLLAADVCASAVVMLDTPCSEVVWRVLATHSIRQVSPSVPLPCVTVCHHIPTGLYTSKVHDLISHPRSGVETKSKTIFPEATDQKIFRLLFWIRISKLRPPATRYIKICTVHFVLADTLGQDWTICLSRSSQCKTNLYTIEMQSSMSKGTAQGRCVKIRHEEKTLQQMLFVL